MSSNEILFIADEVMTGIARTGAMFGMQHFGVEPDLMALGKRHERWIYADGGGSGQDHVMEPILKGSKSIMSGHTYSANPQSAAVSLAVLAYIEKHQLVRRQDQRQLFAGSAAPNG